MSELYFPPDPKSEQDIISTWSGDVDKPIVSICCFTFNHVLFIKDALNGFLMQVTEFPFEIIIHDDCSTDGTADIIRDYQKRYPNIIRAIIQRKNQYSQGIRPSSIVFPLVSSEYLAFCEGDDYWITANKLSLQHQFLESNADYGLVITDFSMLNVVTDELKQSLFKSHPADFPKVLDIESFILKGAYMAPCTWFLKTDYYYKPKPNVLDGTFCWYIDLLEKTNVKVLEETTAVYRVLEESASHTTNVEKKYRREASILSAQLEYANKFKLSNNTINKIYQKHFNMVIHLLVILGEKNKIKFLKSKVPFYKFTARGKIILILSFLPFSSFFFRKLYQWLN